jgi:ABC-type glycerol-3-phosphate transport system substrate-binding protein
MGNIIVDCDENREAGRWLSNLYKKGGIKIEHNLNGARVLFASDRLAFMIDGPQARAYLRRFSSLGAGFDNHYGIAGMPVGPTEKHESVLLTPSLAISKNTSYPEEACRLIEYISTSETLSKKFFDETGMIPCNRDILHQPVYANDPFASVVIGQTEVASVSPFTHPLFHRSYPFIIQFFYRMILEELDPASQLKELRDIIDILGQADYLSMP